MMGNADEHIILLLQKHDGGKADDSTERSLYQVMSDSEASKDQPSKSGFAGRASENSCA